MIFTSKITVIWTENKNLKRTKCIGLYHIIIFTNPSALAGYDTRSVFKQSLTGLNSEFSFSLTSCLTKAEKPSLPYYLPIAAGRIIGFIPFPRVLVLCEMLSISSRILSRVAVSISYDDNHYTTGISHYSIHQFPKSMDLAWLYDRLPVFHVAGIFSS